MLRIETTPRFERRLIAFLKSHPDLRERTRALIDRLAENPFGTVAEWQNRRFCHAEIRVILDKK